MQNSLKHTDALLSHYISESYYNSLNDILNITQHVNLIL